MLTLAFALPAAACGGFFCSPAIAPIDQAAEEIVFAYDEEQGLVEMHIEITYDGQSDDFAWVLPVPAEPELFLSSNDMFAQLSAATAPTFTTNLVQEGRCARPVRLGCASFEASLSGGVAQDGIYVVDEERIGPYDTVTLQAESADALLTWLTDNNYDLPSEIEPLLEVYISATSHFVAMRLAADQDTGDIEPIAMRYPASGMAIPIQLTAIAAAADMPLRVYVFADERAVPESYLSVEINEAAIDWVGGGSNYYEVVEAAANEADGHAFVTEFAGKSDVAADFGSDSLLIELVSRYPYLTRMTAVLSPDEMTVDPTFVLNKMLPDVAKDHVADMIVDCSGGKKQENAPMHIRLADGREIHHGKGLSQSGETRKSVADLQDVPAMAILDLSVADGEEIAHFSNDAEESLDSHNRPHTQGGCGCSTAPIPNSIFGLAALAFLVRRRRTRRA